MLATRMILGGAFLFFLLALNGWFLGTFLSSHQEERAKLQQERRVQGDIQLTDQWVRRMGQRYDQMRRYLLTLSPKEQRLRVAEDEDILAMIGGSLRWPDDLRRKDEDVVVTFNSRKQLVRLPEPLGYALRISSRQKPRLDLYFKIHTLHGVMVDLTRFSEQSVGVIYSSPAKGFAMFSPQSFSAVKLELKDGQGEPPQRVFFPSLGEGEYLRAGGKSHRYDYQLMLLTPVSELDALPREFYPGLILAHALVFVGIGVWGWFFLWPIRGFQALEACLPKEFLKGPPGIARVWSGLRELIPHYQALKKDLGDHQRALQEKELEIGEKERVILSIVEDLELEKNKLKENSKILQAVMHNIGEGIIFADPTGKILLHNKTATMVFGPKPEQVWVPHGPMPGLYEEDGKTPFFGETSPLRLALREGKSRNVVVYFQKDAKAPGRYLAVASETIWDHREGLLGALMTFRDITVERLEKKRLQLILNATPSGMLLVDEEHRIVEVNQATEEIFGYQGKELVGLSVHDLVPLAKRRPHEEMARQFFRDHRSRRFGTGKELTGVKKDGSLVPLMIGLTPFDMSGKAYVVAAVVDLTPQKEYLASLEAMNRELRRSNEDLSDFAYVTSHDLRSPLRAIDHLAQWIEKDSGAHLSEESKKDLALLRSRVVRMDQLLEGLLQYSRISQLDSEVQTMGFSALIHEVVDLLDKPKEFRIEIPAKLPTITTKLVPLRSVLMNLISNAIKHRKTDHDQVRVFCLHLGHRLKICVIDNGPGIPFNQLSAVFGIFKTLKSKDELETSGMGLAIVKKTVQKMGEEVIALRNPTGGSAFVFGWPLWEPNLTPPPEANEWEVLREELERDQIPMALWVEPGEIKKANDSFKRRFAGASEAMLVEKVAEWLQNALGKKVELRTMFETKDPMIHLTHEGSHCVKCLDIAIFHDSEQGQRWGVMVCN